MRITKPFKLGILHKPYQFEGKHHLVVAGMVFFRLGEAGTLLEERFGWPAVNKSLPPQTVLDMIMPKTTGEALLAGNAHAPQGKAVTEVDVTLQVGSINKTLRVMGDRQWRYGLIPLHQISKPKPFTTMPLVWERSYGGETYKFNPQGTGYAGSRLGAIKGINQGNMPNLEYHHELVKSHASRYEPAGFGAINMNWPQRQKLAGTYDKAWKENDAPGLARDIDWNIFNAAPKDQWNDGYFQGGEAYHLMNCSADAPVVSGVLPSLRVRPFIERSNGGFEEIDTVMDTVWFFPEERMGVALYRGQTVVEHRQAKDIVNLMLAYEAQQDQPRSLAYYREALTLRTDKKTAARHVFNESQLSPVLNDVEKARRAKVMETAEAEDMKKRQAVIDERSAEIWKKSGEQPPADFTPPKAEPPVLGVIPQSLLDSGDFDLTAFLEKADKVADDAKKKGEEKRKELEERRKELVKELAALGHKEPEPAKADWNEVYQRAAELPRDLYPDLPPPVASPLQQLIRDAKAAGGAVTDEQQKQVDQFNQKSPALKRMARQANPSAAFPETPLSDEQAMQLGQCVKQWLSEKQPLAGRDWAGANLSGLDFSGCDLREVLLENTNLQGCRFKGALLHKAVFAGANLSGADFTGATLTHANLCSVTAHGAIFDQCDLSDSRWMGSDASESFFNGATLHRVLFTNTQLKGVQAQGASLQHVTGYKAQLQGSDWSGSKNHLCSWAMCQLDDSVWQLSQWHQVAMAECSMTGIDLSQARADALCLVKVNATGGNFTGLRGRQCGWRGGVFDQANMQGINLMESDLGEASFQQADLSQGVFARCLMMGANLTGANVSHVNGYQSKAGELIWQDAILDHGNWMQADLSLVAGDPKSQLAFRWPDGTRSAA